MKNFNLNDLIKKAEEEKALEFFIEIVNFVKEVKPILEKMNSTIFEGSNKMPTASKKISKVTEATEIATTEIMNILDEVFKKINIIRNSPNKKEILDDIELDLNNIMMSLQIQDITSQQLAAVNHLILSITDKLNQILINFDSDYIKEILSIDVNNYSPDSNVTQLHRQVAFDPEAIDSYTNKINRQDKIDEILDLINKGEDINNLSFDNANSLDKNNIDDISKIVNSTSIDFSNEEIDSLFNQSNTIVQDDIDALFGNNNDEEISSDDIDALFSK